MKLILKHSFRCPISARARGEVERFLKRHEKEGRHRLTFELVDVIDNRARSDEIASQTGIPHQSPQVLLFDDEDRLIWHTSHRDITREALWEVIEEKEEE